MSTNERQADDSDGFIFYHAIPDYEANPEQSKYFTLMAFIIDGC